MMKVRRVDPRCLFIKMGNARKGPTTLLDYTRQIPPFLAFPILINKHLGSTLRTFIAPVGLVGDTGNPRTLVMMKVRRVDPRCLFIKMDTRQIPPFLAFPILINKHLGSTLRTFIMTKVRGLGYWPPKSHWPGRHRPRRPAPLRGPECCRNRRRFLTGTADHRNLLRLRQHSGPLRGAGLRGLCRPGQ
jgi:hypothetical protein